MLDFIGMHSSQRSGSNEKLPSITVAGAAPDLSESV
jgi:hypothetical protein